MATAYVSTRVLSPFFIGSVNPFNQKFAMRWYFHSSGRFIGFLPHRWLCVKFHAIFQAELNMITCKNWIAHKLLCDTRINRKTSETQTEALQTGFLSVCMGKNKYFHGHTHSNQLFVHSIHFFLLTKASIPTIQHRTVSSIYNVENNEARHRTPSHLAYSTLNVFIVWFDCLQIKYFATFYRKHNSQYPIYDS